MAVIKFCILTSKELSKRQPTVLKVGRKVDRLKHGADHIWPPDEYGKKRTNLPPKEDCSWYKLPVRITLDPVVQGNYV